MEKKYLNKCQLCKGNCSQEYNQCYNCFNKNKFIDLGKIIHNSCIDCKHDSGKYKRCYNCNLNRQELFERCKSDFKVIQTYEEDFNNFLIKKKQEKLKLNPFDKKVLCDESFI